MLKFFRRIRQKLIDEGNLKRYLIYAIGEILLVVVGILLALQINNWNEDRISQNEIKSLISAFKKENLKNSESLKSRIERSQEKRMAMLELLSIIGPHSENHQKEKVNELVYASIGGTIFDPLTIAINNLQESGKMNQIKNDSLRQLFALWQSKMKFIKNAEARYGDRLFSQILPYLYDKFLLLDLDKKHGGYEEILPSSKFDVSHTKILRDLKFENMIDDQFYTRTLITRSYKELLEIMIKLETIISKEYSF